MAAIRFGVGIEPGQNQDQQQKAFQIQQSKFDEMNIQELNKCIDEAIESNPFLEYDTSESDCLKTSPTREKDPDRLPNDGNFDGTSSDKGYTVSAQKNTDYKDFAATDAQTLLQEIAYEKAIAKADTDLCLLAVLINHLDEHCFLSRPIDPDKIQEEFFIDKIQNVDFDFILKYVDKINAYINFQVQLNDLPSQLKNIVTRLSTLGPKGLGARSKGEYLLTIANGYPEFPEWAKEIFKTEQLFDALTAGNFNTITDKLGKDENEIRNAMSILKGIYLYPSEEFNTAAQYQTPSVKIYQKGDDFFVELLSVKKALHQHVWVASPPFFVDFRLN